MNACGDSRLRGLRSRKPIGFRQWVVHPGEEKEVQLTQMGGRKRVFGLNDLTRARAGEDTKKASMEKAALKGFV